ncbi:TetR/AcrR family transcriptional regulator [Lacticaseibacillus yichunensis]|uniref:TetR/AcrR family transcriptional regulator n=1 Tax=Lacticaseibacillus yichunensis TaxID=2486015 RepID=A0ABW4CNF3_9LACO|nr:TetR/AcrR family transcriptional regulator [Lacticaseibacillus yichunensis]
MLSEDERKDDLLTRIDQVLVRDGLNGLAMGTLAKRVGVSRGKLYLYFESKEAVIEAVVAQQSAIIEAASAGRDEALALRLVDELTVLTAGSPLFLSDLMQQYPRLAARLNRVLNEWQAQLADELQAGINKGRLQAIDPVLLLRVLKAGVGDLLADPRFGGDAVREALTGLLQLQLVALVGTDKAAKALSKPKLQQRLSLLVTQLAERYPQ